MQNNQKITTDYNIAALKIDLDNLNYSIRPKNWGYSLIPITGVYLFYFGDTFVHSTRSILIKMDMTVEVHIQIAKI